MKTRYRHTINSPPETIIKRYGYEWVLVEAGDRDHSQLPQPCFMGFPNMVLKAVRKIKK